MDDSFAYLLNAFEREDISCLFSYEGKIIGKCGSCTLEALPNYFSKAFQSSLKQAKSAMIVIGCSPTLHSISDVFAFFMDELDENANIFFSTQERLSSNDSNIVDFMVLLTGIDDESN